MRELAQGGDLRTLSVQGEKLVASCSSWITSESLKTK